jgi:hypothetical protein
MKIIKKIITGQFICGLIDADGCFSLRLILLKNKKINIQLNFTITAHYNIYNYKMFEEIIKIIGVGKIYIIKNIIRLNISKLEDCVILIKFLNQYSLHSYKCIDFKI